MKKKDIIQIGITGVLLVVLLLFLSHGRKPKKTANGPLNKNVSLSPAADVQKTGGSEFYKRLEEETKSMELKRDPFTFTKQQAGPSVVSARELILSGIAWDQDNPSAIINNKIVAIGQEVDGNTVVDIKENRVILNDGDHNFELRIE